MTAPRQILPGTTYLITRRCAQRQLLLRPSPELNAIFSYLLALAAQRCGVLVHAVCVMSNHFHLVVTDPNARLPRFEQILNSLVARAVNALLGRWESFWAPSSYSAVTLADPADIVAKVAYVLANPATAGLVRRGRDWPGVWSAPEMIGTAAVSVPRPSTFFRKNGYLPGSIDLELAVPPGFGSAEEFREQVTAALAAREEQAAQDLASRGRGVLGAKRVLRQSPMSRPGSVEERRALSPRVAAYDKWRRIEVLSRLEAFVTDYRRAWAAWRAGKRTVEFPAGTYWMRVAHGVVCAAAT